MVCFQTTLRLWIGGTTLSVLSSELIEVGVEEIPGFVFRV